MIQEPEIYNKVGLPSDQVIDEIGKLLSRYKIPIGLVNKLMNQYHGFEFVIDESGSMMSHTDTMDARVRPITRWQEEKDILKIMIEVLAYVPAPPMEVKFLNRTGIPLNHREGPTPAEFIAEAYTLIDRAFTRLPTILDTTSNLDAIKALWKPGVEEALQDTFSVAESRTAVIEPWKESKK
jgi:hypothetical protein